MSRTITEMRQDQDKKDENQRLLCAPEVDESIETAISEEVDINLEKFARFENCEDQGREHVVFVDLLNSHIVRNLQEGYIGMTGVMENHQDHKEDSRKKGWDASFGHDNSSTGIHDNCHVHLCDENGNKHINDEDVDWYNIKIGLHDFENDDGNLNENLEVGDTHFKDADIDDQKIDPNYFKMGKLDLLAMTVFVLVAISLVIYFQIRFPGVVPIGPWLSFSSSTRHNSTSHMGTIS